MPKLPQTSPVCWDELRGTLEQALENDLEEEVGKRGGQPEPKHFSTHWAICLAGALIQDSRGRQGKGLELEGKPMTLSHGVWAPAVCFSVYSGCLFWVRNGKQMIQR